jgi:hypothetical protein
VSSGCYELLLRFPDGHEELKLTDHLDHFERAPDLLLIRSTYWRVTERTQASMPTLSERLVCVADTSRTAPSKPARVDRRRTQGSLPVASRRRANHAQTDAVGVTPAS